MLMNDIKHDIDKKDELLPYCPKKNPTKRNPGRINLSKRSLAILAFVLLLMLDLTPFLPLPGDENPPKAPTTVGGTSTGSGSGFIAREYDTDLVYTVDGGFALAITTRFELTGDSDIMLVKTGMDGTVEWSKTYGKSQDDRAGALVQTTDGGYALAGSTEENEYRVLWLIKTDSEGNVEWNETHDPETFGCNSFEGISSIIQTSDSGFALTLAGYRRWVNGWLPVASNLLVKIDSNGALEWSWTYEIDNSKGHESIVALVQTGDAGFALAGRVFYDIYGSGDMWLLKTDGNGILEWSKTYGGTIDDGACSLIQTGDGGFALVGFTISPEKDRNMLLVKTDGSGTMEWSKTYGGSKHDEAYSLVQTADGGFALAGCIDYDDSRSDSDTWLVKTDSNGILEWNKTYGGEEDDGAEAVIQATDGSFVIAGFTETIEWTFIDRDSFGKEFKDIIDNDVWLMKTDESGNEQWKYYFDSTQDEEWANDLIQTSDGGFILTGPVGSRNTRRMDVQLLKTDWNGVIEWDRTFGGQEDDGAEAVIQTADGGFLIAGYTSSDGAGKKDAWLVKTDGNGLVTWNKTYGGEEDDGAEAVIQTADGGFALAGFTRSSGTNDSDAWLVKTDANGTVEWNRTFGGDLDDSVTDIYQLVNGSFILHGYYGQELKTAICDYQCYFPHSDIYDNAWLLVVGSNGALLQDFIYERLGFVRFHDIRSTGDGLDIAGLSTSQGDWSTGWMTGIGNDSLFYLRINGNGIYEWNKTLDGLSWPRSRTNSFLEGDFIYTTDGGFILIGNKDPGTVILNVNHWSLVKMDSNGLVQWNLDFGINNIGTAPVLIQTADGGYAFAWGVLSRTAGGDSADAYLLRIDENGTLLWQQVYGKTDDEVYVKIPVMETVPLITPSCSPVITILFLTALVILRKRKNTC